MNGYTTMKEMFFSRYLFIFGLLSVTSVIWSEPDKVLKESIGCQQRSTSGRDYIGKANTTVDGIRCQRWSKTQRVETFNTKPYNRSFTNVGDHNFCRNPIGGEPTQSQFWCYTTDPLHEKQNCSVPFCPPLKALDFFLDNDKKMRSRYGREWFGPESIDRTSNLARISPLERSPIPRMAGAVFGDRLRRLTPDQDPKEMRGSISVTGFGGQGER